jgi:glycosyltransferase involved in cell wall biosynthesis
MPPATPCSISANLTVVVPTRDEAANVERFLRSLPESVPLIVVDKSDDATRDIIRTVRPRNTVVLDCHGTLTEARQLGAERATTRWLLFTDADVAFAADYFASLDAALERVAAHGAPEPGLVYGPKLSAGEYRGYYRALARAQRLIDLLSIPAASGSNMIVSAKAFAAVGGFDTVLRCNEDSELGWRIARAGFRCRFDPRLVVWAVDHRRLHRGRLRKTLHTVARCAALFFGLIPQRWRSRDWGYWSDERRRA